MRLVDKVCIVTGAASGTGKEIALTYAREGGRLAVADIDKAAAQATVDQILAAGGWGRQAAGQNIDAWTSRGLQAARASVTAAIDTFTQVPRSASRALLQMP